MSTPLRVLIIDDAEHNAVLMVDELQRAAYDVTFERVDTFNTLSASLETQQWDVILSDYSLTKINGLVALTLVKDKGLDLPVIFVSSIDGAEAAVAALKAGASDFFTKDKLHRLVPSVECELMAARTRREAQQAQHQEKIRYQALFNQTNDAVFWFATDHRIFKVNERAAEMTGYSADELAGMHISQLIARHQYPDAMRVAELLKIGQSPPPYERILIKKDGSEHPIEVNIAPVFLNGEHLYNQSLVRDITERKRAEALLASERNLLRTVIDHLPHYIFVKDSEDRFVDSNLATAHLLGAKSPTELIGKTDFDYFPEDLATQYYADDMRIIRDGQSIIDLEEITLDETGSPIWVTVTKLPIFDNNGQPNGLVGMGINITERKQAESQRLALQIEKEKVHILRRFLNDFSHDLRTPLSVIKSSLYLLKRLADSEKLINYVERLESQTDRIHWLFEDMVTLLQLDLSATSFSFTHVDLNRVIDSVFGRFQSQASKKNLQFQQALDSDLLSVFADESRLMDAIGCIIGNAVNYTPQGGQITVSSTHSEQYAVVEVRDNGIGISADDLPHIFKRFYRADKARGLDTGGSGLGLPIAEKIIEAHGGQIEVNSEIGKGSVFRIKLSLDTVPEPVLAN